MFHIVRNLFGLNRIFGSTHSIIVRFRSLCLFLAVCLSLHVFSMMELEGLSFLDAVWFTMTSAFTVGYGDIAPKQDLSKFLTIVLVYFGSILTIGKAASDWFDFRNLRREEILTGRWEHKMKKHLVIFGSPKHGYVEFFEGIKEELLMTFADQVPSVLVVTEHWGGRIDSRLLALNYAFLNGSPYNPDILQQVSLHEASYVMVLVDSFIPNEKDCANIELVARIRESGYKGPLVAEISSLAHKDRMLKVGATSIMRPLRSHPEVLVKSMVHPGTEEIFDNLFSCSDDNLVRVDVSFQGTWLELIQKCITEKQGLPLAVITVDGKTLTNPVDTSRLDVKSIYLLLKEDTKTVQRGRELHQSLKRRSA